MGARNEFGSTVSLTNLLTVSQLGCEQKKLLGFGGLCRAPLTLNFSQDVWVTPPVRVYGVVENDAKVGLELNEATHAPPALPSKLKAGRRPAVEWRLSTCHGKQRT